MYQQEFDFNFYTNKAHRILLHLNDEKRIMNIKKKYTRQIFTEGFRFLVEIAVWRNHFFLVRLVLWCNGSSISVKYSYTQSIFIFNIQFPSHELFSNKILSIAFHHTHKKKIFSLFQFPFALFQVGVRFIFFFFGILLLSCMPFSLFSLLFRNRFLVSMVGWYSMFNP